MSKPLRRLGCGDPYRRGRTHGPSFLKHTSLMHRDGGVIARTPSRRTRCPVACMTRPQRTL